LEVIDAVDNAYDLYAICRAVQFLSALPSRKTLARNRPQHARKPPQQSWVFRAQIMCRKFTASDFPIMLFVVSFLVSVCHVSACLQNTTRNKVQ
jgi:hypothetical protein